MFTKPLYKKYLTIVFLLFSITITSCELNTSESKPEIADAQTPKITEISSDIITNKNKNISISIKAEINDGGKLTYQWYTAKDKITIGNAIEEATDSEYQPPVNKDGNFYYYCVITNNLKSDKDAITSPRILVTVLPAINAKTPEISSQPTDGIIVISAEHTLTVGASASDGGTISYQWYSISAEENAQGAIITGAINSKLQLSAEEEGITGYYCVITNTITDNGDGGVKTANITTNTAWLEAKKLYDVVGYPVFKLQPKTMAVKQNEEYILTCKAEVEHYETVYKWYELQDGKIETKIPLTTEWSSNSNFKVTAFNNKGIRYFVCAAEPYVSERNTYIDKLTFSEVVCVAYTGLALLKIDTEDGAMPTSAKEKHNGRLCLYRGENLIYDSGEANELTIKVRGNATAFYPKQSYKIKLPKKANLLNMDNPLQSNENKDKNWVLLANYCDKTLLRNSIGFYTASLFNEIDGNENLYVPHYEFVDVILNGEYLGNYCLTDSVKEGSSRCAVNEKSTNSGGIGIVAEYDPRYYKQEDKWIISEQKYPYTFKYPDAEENDVITYMAISKFGDYINHFEDALYNNESQDDWKNYIDIESFARWFLINNILANSEPNYFIYKQTSDDSSKFIMGPVWDFEWSIGIGWYYGERPRSPDYICVNDWYFSELLKQEEFINEIKKQWNNIKNDESNLELMINSKMDELANTIEFSQKMNFTRWAILNKQISVGGIPLGSYDSELNCDKQFIIDRINWLEEEIKKL